MVNNHWKSTMTTRNVSYNNEDLYNAVVKFFRVYKPRHKKKEKKITNWKKLMEGDKK